MIRRTPRSTRTYTRFPYPTFCRTCHGIQGLVGQFVQRLQIFAHRPRAHAEYRVVDRPVIGLAHRADAVERPALRDEAAGAGDVAVEAGARHARERRDEPVAADADHCRDILIERLGHPDAVPPLLLQEIAARRGVGQLGARRLLRWRALALIGFKGLARTRTGRPPPP